MKKADLYKKIIYWSKEDQCFVGVCPELMDGGIHGDDALNVFTELCEAVDEVIELYELDGRILPVPQDFDLVAA